MPESATVLLWAGFRAPLNRLRGAARSAIFQIQREGWRFWTSVVRSSTCSRMRTFDSGAGRWER